MNSPSSLVLKSLFPGEREREREREEKRGEGRRGEEGGEERKRRRREEGRDINEQSTGFAFGEMK